MKQRLVIAAFGLCLAAWAWFTWFYVLPVAAFYFELLEQRQGFMFACQSMGVTLTLCLFVLFGCAACIKRAIDEGTAGALLQAVGYGLVLPPTIVLDWLLNWTAFWAWFAERPKTAGELITGRMKRYKYEAQYQGTVRLATARVFALLLNPLDKGHI